MSGLFSPLRPVPSKVSWNLENGWKNKVYLLNRPPIIAPTNNGPIWNKAITITPAPAIRPNNGKPGRKPVNTINPIIMAGSNADMIALPTPPHPKDLAGRQIIRQY